MLLNKDIIRFLEEKFPTSLAYDWDNVGLQVGDVNREVKKILVALDMITPIVDEAIEKKIDLIITHHPLIFSPLKSINFETSRGKNIAKLIKNDITAYTMHTNYDIAPGGMNDVLAQQIGLCDISPLVMIDEIHGLGRIGKLKHASSISSLSTDIKTQLKPYVSSIDKVECANIESIETVAVIGGSGGKYIHEAKEAGADVLITGDVTYHIAIDAKDIELSLLDIGHHAEVIMQDAVCDLLNKEFDDMLAVSSENTKNPIW